MKRVFIKPRDGVRVRDPQSNEYISQDGQALFCSAYWKRREADGDVQISNSKPLSKSKAKGKK